MNALAALAVLAALAWYWQDSARSRERVLARARIACTESGVQLLDQSVALVRLRLGRDRTGRLGLQRDYAFEFSVSGVDRRPGQARLTGSRIDWVRLELPDGPILSGTTAAVHRGPWGAP